MKRIALSLALLCALGISSVLWAQEEPQTAPDQPVAAAAPSQPSSMPDLQKQIDELRAKLQELEAQLQQAQAAQEQTNRDVYAVNDSVSKTVTGEKIKVSGYIQSQLTNDQAIDPHTDFRVRRARVKFEAPVTDIASGTIEIDATRTVELKEAFIDLFYQPTYFGRLRFGQAKVPDMYDILESSSTRLAPEQTALAQYLFPGEYDQGLWYHINNLAGDCLPGTTLDLGVQDGQGPNTPDLNDNKDFLARLRFALGNAPPDKVRETNTAYLGYVNGQFSALDSARVLRTTPKDYYGGGISYQLGRMWVRGEYQQGQKLGADFQGYYGQLAYGYPTDIDTPFIRYDVLNQNTDVPNATFTDWTFGWQHFLDARTRLVLAYEHRHPDPGYSAFKTTNGGLGTLRLQVKF